MANYLEEAEHDWMAVAHAPDGTEFVLNNWLPVTISISAEGRSMSYTTADLAQAQHIHPLVSDIYLYRDKQLFDQLRVVDDTDTFTPNGHTVTFDCVSYEALLGRRILHDDWIDKRGDQNDLAWAMVQETQHYQSFGITRASNVPHGKQRSRTIRAGVTIRDGLNDLAQVENGFDWWIDQDLAFHTQSPRRERNLNRALGWGQGFQEISRSGAADSYSSRIRTQGAKQETVIPGSTGGPAGNGVYPPPKPQVYRADLMPYGLWEATFNYPDVVTEATLKERAEYNLKDTTALRASYRCVFEPGIWNPDIQIGDMFQLRVLSPPRTQVNDLVRIEEIEIQLEPSGAEVVTVMVRSETDEIPHFTADFPAVPIVPGEVLVTAVPGSGRTAPARRIAATAEWAAMLTQLARRVTRVE